MLLKRIQRELARVVVVDHRAPKSNLPKLAEIQLTPAQRLRKYISETWPLWNAFEVHAHESTSGSRPNATTAHRLREAGKILGLKVGAAFQYPAFQFDAGTGQPRAEMSELLSILPKDATGWRCAFWLAQPDRRLAAEQLPLELDAEGAIELLEVPSGARTPADVFPLNPGQVVAFARQEFRGA